MKIEDLLVRCYRVERQPSGKMKAIEDSSGLYCAESIDAIEAMLNGSDLAGLKRVWVRLSRGDRWRLMTVKDNRPAITYHVKGKLRRRIIQPRKWYPYKIPQEWIEEA